MLKKSALKEKEKEARGKKLEEVDDVVDSENVNELNDLFSTIESEFGEGSAIDFSVLLEGDHAFNVEEVSEIFTDLEQGEVPVVTENDVHDAAVVDDMAALFASLEEKAQQEDEAADTDSDRNSVTVVEEVEEQDADNVDELSDLFTALEDKEEQQASQDWIASLDVDDVSNLYSELEKLQQPSEPTEERAQPTATVVVDPRIFVPRFSIRMDGAAAARPLPRVPATGAFLAGPPVLLTGPPVHRVAAGVVLTREQKDPKRKAADPSISDTRRVCAAKRRRVNGRFVREQNSFVSITALQPSP